MSRMHLFSQANSVTPDSVLRRTLKRTLLQRHWREVRDICGMKFEKEEKEKEGGEGKQEIKTF